MTPGPRPLPAFTVDGLRPPLPGYPYFAHADAYPFDPSAPAGAEGNAWWLADACFLVYGDAAFVRRAFEASPLPALGFALEWLGTPEVNRGIVLSRDDAAVVVFRGTRLTVHSVLDVAEVVVIDQADFWTDARFLPAACAAGGRVHTGFLAAYRDVSDRLDAVADGLRPGQRLWLTGHSLGGALATLAAAHLGPDRCHGLVTFGSPRVGDAAFAATLPEGAHARYVHGADWVPTVPPEFLGYAHAGPARPVTGGPPRGLWGDVTAGAQALSQALKAMARDLRLGMGDLPITVAGLADHAPVYYATHLWNARVGTGPG